MGKILRKIILSTARVWSALILGISLSAGMGGILTRGASAQQYEKRHIQSRNFEVEVLVEGRPAQEYFARGRRYIEAARNAEYELRIRNPLPVRVAVALSVDGLNTIDARRTGSWAASKWVIEPYQTITVGGWQMSTERARRFYFTSERDSYAAKLGRASDLGVIAAVFFREQTPQPIPLQRGGIYGGPREREERSADKSASAPAERAENKSRQSGRVTAPNVDDDYAATGIGRSIHNDVRWVHLNLDSRPAGEVTIRYEYHDALVKLGILPRPRPDGDALRRREQSRGFEEGRFSPEP
ncbi:MAG TPA: hypothetical protein VM943_02415 [Pyrinomonadaceae bacterium]|nr:hypothetical protein [Pyrinomonadaceae bacterium]